MKPILFYFILLTGVSSCFGEDRFFEGFTEETIQSKPQINADKPEDHFFSTHEARPADPNEKSEIFAYVHSHLVQIKGTDVLVNRDFANLRQMPSRYSRIINLGKLGDSFPYAGSIPSPDDGQSWIKVWLRDPLVAEPGGERVRATVSAAVSVFLRQTPPKNGRNGSIVGTLYRDETVLVDLDESFGNWYRVYASGKDGYAHKKYIKLLPGGNGPVANIPKPSPMAAATSEEGPRVNTAESSSSQGVNRGAVKRHDGGVEVVGVPMLYQGKTDPYDPNGGSGWRPQAYCGPTSLQMVLAYHGVRQSRDGLALTRLNSKGEVIQTNYRSSQFRGQVYAKDQGSAYAPMVAMAKHLGFKNTTQQFPSLDPNPRSSKLSMREMLEAGRPQIVAVSGLLRYTDGTQWRSQGHVMVVRGMTGNGDLILHDPARNGGDKIMRRRDFTRIWRGFTVDIKR